MSIFARATASIRGSRLQTKLILSYIILITIPILLFSASYYRLGKGTMIEFSQNDAYTILQKNTEIIDSKLSRVREMIYAFTEDAEFAAIFKEIDPTNRQQILSADLRITEILNKYFAQSQDIYSVQVATTYFTFGQDSSANSEHGKNFIPKGAFADSELFRQAYGGEGRIVWMPTYSFADMFHLDYLKDAEIDYRYLLSAVRKLNIPFARSGTAFNASREQPVIIVNFKETVFSDVFAGSMPTAGSYYIVVDEAGHVISHRDKALLATRLEWDELAHMASADSGVRIMEIDGEDRIVCFNRSTITGWPIITVIPLDELLDPIIDEYMRNMLIAAGLLTLLFILFSSYLSGIITHPIRTVIRAITNTGEGKFQMKYKEHGSYEFQVLMRKFADMNEKIERLIEENYGSKIREKEAEIKALNLQLDPHFMHNTLNLISLLSMEKGEDEISELITGLSYMMKYIVRNEGLVTFADDFNYLKSYSTIMTKRFDGKYQVVYEVDPRLNRTLVPKFFLQPIVENALIHGFNQLDRPGIIRIRCFVQDEMRIFIVEDNGKGMTEEQLSRLTGPVRDSVGLNNVSRRIQVIYGEPYGMTIDSIPDRGTTVTVRMPMQLAELKHTGED